MNRLPLLALLACISLMLTACLHPDEVFSGARQLTGGAYVTDHFEIRRVRHLTLKPGTRFTVSGRIAARDELPVHLQQYLQEVLQQLEQDTATAFQRYFQLASDGQPFDVVIEPVLVQVEDIESVWGDGRHPGPSGRDQVTLEVVLKDAQTGTMIDVASISGKSGWLTFFNDSANQLAAEAMFQLARSYASVPK